MLQAETQDCSGSAIVRAVAEEPQQLERGMRLLDRGFRLTPELAVDLWLQDAARRPVIVLGEGGEPAAALLGRALCVVAEVRRMRNLLERLFQQEGVSFEAAPRVLLVATRFSDALLGARDWLAAFSIELVEARLCDREDPHRVVVVRAGEAVRDATSPAADSRVPATNGKSARNGSAAHAAPAPPPAPVAAPATRDSLLDELKRKVLRISDRIEEEVEGAATRFLLHDELLVEVTAQEGGVAARIGDDEAPRRLHDRATLLALVDEVVRRYFVLTRQQPIGGKPAPGGTAPARR